MCAERYENVSWLEKSRVNSVTKYWHHRQSMIDMGDGRAYSLRREQPLLPSGIGSVGGHALEAGPVFNLSLTMPH